jgi:nitroreductase
MKPNTVIEQMLVRKSIRKYTDREPSDDVVEAIVRAGQQAPFAAQLGSVLLKRDRDSTPFRAPLPPEARPRQHPLPGAAPLHRLCRRTQAGADHGEARVEDQGQRPLPAPVWHPGRLLHG